MNRTPRLPRLFLAGITPLVLLAAGCGGGGGDEAPPPPRFTLGGTVTGLTSDGLLLANGSDTVAVAANATTFTLPATLLAGSTFDVRVDTQTDDRTCTVTNGSGTMGSANVSDISVSCVAASFSVVSTLAGSGLPDNLDGQGTAAAFNSPAGVATDASGTVYVADSTNNTIRKIAPDGTVSTFAGSGAIGRTDGLGTAASFRAPTGMAIDANGNVFVADRFNNQIRRITAAGEVSTIVSLATSPFNQPTGIAVDAGGNLYVADSLHHTIHKIAPDGTLAILAGTTNVVGSADGPGASATLNEPFGLTIDASGNLFVAERSGQKIRKITPDGTVSTVAGSGLAGNTDGPGATARFNQPAGIAVGASGFLYVSEIDNRKIRVVTPDGNVSTLAGTGAAGSTDGDVTTATFNGPFGVAIDRAGNVYVADTRNHTIRKIARD